MAYVAASAPLHKVKTSSGAFVNNGSSEALHFMNALLFGTSHLFSLSWENLPLFKPSCEVFIFFFTSTQKAFKYTHIEFLIRTIGVRHTFVQLRLAGEFLRGFTSRDSLKLDHLHLECKRGKHPRSYLYGY